MQQRRGERGGSFVELLLHLRQALLMVAYLAVQLAQLTIALGLHSIGEGLTSWSQAESNGTQTGIVCRSPCLLSGCLGERMLASILSQ